VTTGPLGLVLPTLPQQTTPAWAAPHGHRDPGTERAGGGGDGAPGGPESPDPIAELAAVCRQAEELGAGALWACDHLFWHGPVLESLVTLTVAATATRHTTLGTCVVQLPMRTATVVAKQAASLQQLSRGRLVLGVGVGSHAGEYEQAGADYATRGRRLDEGIAELRRSWGTAAGCTRGDLAGTAADRYRQLPGTPPVPVWVGGSSTAALERAAALADGWIPLFLDRGEYATAIERLAKEVDRAGRPADAVTRSMVLFVSVDDDAERGRMRGTAWMSSLYGLPAKAFERHLVAGSAAAVAETVHGYREAGAEHVAVYVTADAPLEQFARLRSALGPDADRRGPRDAGRDAGGDAR